MAQNPLKKELERMMKKCPQCLTPRKIYRYTPLSENRIYELIRSGELPSFIPVTTKEWLIEFYCGTGYEPQHMCEKHKKLVRRYLRER